MKKSKTQWSSYILSIAMAILLSSGCSNNPVPPSDPGTPQVVDRFVPFTSVVTSILPAPTGLPFEGLLNSPGAIISIKNKFYLFYNDNVGGWPPSDINIGYAVSSDLKSWTRNPDVSLSGEHVDYLNGVSQHPSVSSVIQEEDGTLTMYFDVFKSGKATGIGRAVAPGVDGPWVVDSDMVVKPTPGSWDQYGMANASVIKSEDGYRMYYGVFLSPQVNPTMSIGMASSPDGINWTKHPEAVFTASDAGNWDSHKVEVPRVLRTDEGWIMAYRSDDGDSSWGGNSAYGIATSSDGISWSRLQDMPVIHENNISEWATLWASAFFKHSGTYYMFLETDGPPIHGTRVNIVSFKGDFFD